MIQVETTAYPDDRAKQLQDWLRLPACALFLRYLSEQSAQLTADAGNLLVKNEQGDKEDAEAAGELARQIQFMIKFIQTTQGNRQPDEGPFSFQGVDLQPMPVLEVAKTD